MRFVLLSFYVYHPMYYPYVGDSMADHGTFLVGFHKAATSFHAKLNIAMPPVIRAEPLASFMYKPFNSKDYAVSLARHHPEFESNGCVATDPVSTITHTKEQRAKCIYQLYRSADDRNISAGSGVYCLSGLCPPFCATNTNCLSPLLELGLLWKRTYM